MAIHKRYTLPLFALAFTLLLIMSACSQPTLPTSTGGNGASNLTPLQVLQNSANGMKQLKSAHIVLQSTSSLQTTSATSGTPTLSSTPTSLNLSLSGSGDEVLPDQEQLSLSINQNTNIAEIVQGDKVYVKNTQGQWYVLDKSAFQNVVGNPFSGVSLDQNSLLALLQHVQITDHGTQSLNGQNLRHITAVLDKEGLRQLLTDNPQLKGSLSQQNIDALLNSTKTFQSSIDVWIDETQFYVHRTELKLNLTADTSGLSGTPTSAGAIPASVSSSLDTIVDLSNFNAPVTITPPTNAIHTDNPTTVLGLGGQ